jgi:predicted outer membrane protein
MRSLALCALALPLLAACSRGVASDGKFKPEVFVATAVQLGRSDAELGQLAAKRAKVPDVRTFGDTYAADQLRLVPALTAIAARKHIPVPAALQEKQVALRDNLLMLPGQVFDRSYALAMVQDLNTLITAYKAAASSGDPELRAFAAPAIPQLEERRKAANALLDRMGGSPFGFTP